MKTAFVLEHLESKMLQVSHAQCYKCNIPCVTNVTSGVGDACFTGALDVCRLVFDLHNVSDFDMVFVKKRGSIVILWMKKN